jgi:hypothetical protein
MQSRRIAQSNDFCCYLRIACCCESPLVGDQARKGTRVRRTSRYVVPRIVTCGSGMKRLTRDLRAHELRKPLYFSALPNERSTAPLDVT